MNCKGFYISRRGSIWCYFAKPNKNHCSSNTLYKVIDLYADLLREESTEVEIMIEKDLPRTFPEIEEFKIDISTGKNRLYNVLKAYAHYDPKVGYCQGMNYVVAMLLKYIEDEELAFNLFTHLMKGANWRELYLEPMNRLHDLLNLLGKELKRYLPNTYAHLLSLGMEFNGLFSHIFLTAFIYRTPIKLSTRIFDLFIIGHEKVLIGIILNMLRVMEDKVLAFDSMVCVKESSRMCISI